MRLHTFIAATINSKACWAKAHFGGNSKPPATNTEVWKVIDDISHNEKYRYVASDIVTTQLRILVRDYFTI